MACHSESTSQPTTTTTQATKPQPNAPPNKTPTQTTPPPPRCTPPDNHPGATCYNDVQEADLAGTSLWVGELYGNGRSQILVGAIGEWDQIFRVDRSEYVPRPAVYELDLPGPSSTLPEVAKSTYRGVFSLDYWGYIVRGLPSERQVAIASAVEPVIPIHFFESGVFPEATLSDAQGHLRISQFRSFAAYDIADCSGLSKEATLCVSDANGNGNPVYSGQTFIFESPISGGIRLSEAKTVLVGDAGDRAEVLHSENDFDGDGRTDLAIGAYNRNDQRGSVALVSDPPEGNLNVWEVAYATTEGEIDGGKLGIEVESGDLDGDGNTDLLASAPIAGSGTAYVMFGPFDGSRSVSESDVTVSDDIAGLWTGYASAMSDLDGDGQRDLVVGQPRSIFSSEPGEVLVFFDVAPGSLTREDASYILSSGGTTPDAFGLEMGVGDVDGDGTEDLVVAAEGADIGASNVGAIYIFPGSGFQERRAQTYE